jgi:hypothetical protein
MMGTQNENDPVQKKAASLQHLFDHADWLELIWDAATEAAPRVTDALDTNFQHDWNV